MKKELTHNHKMTNIIKTLIFSILMLAPFIAIGVKCLYVVNNENANQSYKGEYSFSFMESLNVSNLVANNNYISTIDFTTITNDKFHAINDYYRNINSWAGLRIKFNDFIISDTYNSIIHYANNYTDLNGVNTISLCNHADWNNPTNMSLWNTNNYNLSSNAKIVIAQDNNIKGYYLIQELPKISFQGEIATINNNFEIWNEWFYPFTQYVVQIDNTLSNVFYSAVQELDKASIFSWTVNTAIYTAVNNMCEALGIVSPPLAVLITYWTLLTIIYVVIDIVIEVFIFLTHWFNDKMV